MANLFTSILNMSLTASIIIFIVLLARLCLKKAPKIYSYLLWSVVLFRLLCPISISLPVSVLAPMSEASTSTGSNYTASMEYISVPEQSQQPEQPRPEHGPGEKTPADGDTSPVVADTPAAIVEQQVTKKLAGEIVLTILGWLWVAGMAGVLGFTTWQTFMLRRKLDTAFLIRGNIFESDKIDTAFVLGAINPKIYLPLDLPFDIQKAVVAHEQTHQRRGDHIVKLVSYLVLAVHWFNPLVWLSFKLMCDDMEKSCDEAVLREMNNRGYSMSSIKKAYGNMLLELGGGKQHIFSPVSFAENSTKSRVKNVVAYNRIARNMGVGLAAVCVLVTLICVVNPTGTAVSVVTGTDTVVSASDEQEYDTPAVEITIGDVTFMSDVTELDLGHQGSIDINDLRHCPNLQSLNLSCSIVHDLSPLRECTKIKELYLCDGNCYSDEVFPGEREQYISVENMRILSQLPNLEVLKLDCIKNESIDVLSDFRSLKSLSLFDAVRNDNKTSQYSSLNKIHNEYVAGVYSIIDCSPDTIEAFDFNIRIEDESIIDALSICPNLKYLNCTIVEGEGIDYLAGFSKLNRLETLIMYHSESFDFAALKEMSNLTYLDISVDEGCEIKNAEAITKCTQLRTLHMENVYNVEFVYELKNLTTLSVDTDGEVFDVSRLNCQDSLTSLGIYYSYVPDVDSIEECKNLQRLTLVTGLSELSRGSGTEFFGFLNQLNQLEYLTLWDTYDYANDSSAELDLTVLSDAIKLKELSIQMGSVYNADGIKRATGLQDVLITTVKDNSDFSFFSEMTQMRCLNLECPNGLSDVSFIAGMSNLEELRLTGNFSDINALRLHKNVRLITLKSSFLESISPLRHCSALRQLYIRECNSLVDTSPLASVETLTELWVENTPIESVGFIGELPGLEKLSLYNTEVTDISPLYDIPTLNWFRLYSRNSVDMTQVDELKSVNPDCEIYMGEAF